MDYTIKNIDDIISFTTWSNKQKQDELLRIDCAMYSFLGTDSSIKDKERVKKNSKYIYKSIKKINPELSEFLLNALDK